MATNLIEETRGGSFLRELLHFAGWRLEIRDGVQPRIHATRADVRLRSRARAWPTRQADSSRRRCARATASARAERWTSSTCNGDWRRLEDELNVLRWRTKRLMALGYDFRRAAFLAYSGVNIHELERLIRKGCPPATAERIAA